MKTFVFYLAVINVITLVLFAIDKLRAKRRQWRISESTLLFFALVGGSLGGLFAMYFFHHKTKTPSFKYGLPIAFAVHIIIAVISVNYLQNTVN